MTVSVAGYRDTDHDRWNAFVARSRNGTFLLCREYMDYHAARFTDHSLLVSDGDERLVAVLPANAAGSELISHGGLTYGGFVVDQTMTVSLMLEVFAASVPAMRRAGFERLLYKTIPHIYHDRPAEEDRYALFRAGARLVRRDQLSVLDLRARYPYQERRRRAIRRAARSGLDVAESDDFGEFWSMLRENLLARHRVSPVHTVEEIELLRRRFPEQIRLFCAHRGSELRAGLVVYVSPHVCHVQYNAASEEGSAEGALDLIVDVLVEHYAQLARYFDFGVSTERQGSWLNAGLAAYKEGFGARTVVHDFYDLDLTACGPDSFQNIR